MQEKEVVGYAFCILALPPHLAALGRAWLVLAWVRPRLRRHSLPTLLQPLVHSHTTIHLPARTGQVRPLRPLHEFILLIVHL